MKKEMAEMRKAIKGKGTRTTSPTRGTGQPLSRSITEREMPKKMKVPTLRDYQGDSDPREHITYFKSTSLIYDWGDSVKCKLFPMTLKGTAQSWYNGLRDRSIHSFHELAEQLELAFVSSRRKRVTNENLLTFHPKDDETLRVLGDVQRPCARGTQTQPEHGNAWVLEVCKDEGPLRPTTASPL